MGRQEPGKETGVDPSDGWLSTHAGPPVPCRLGPAKLFDLPSLAIQEPVLLQTSLVRRRAILTALTTCSLGALGCAPAAGPLASGDLSPSALASRSIAGEWRLVWQDEFSGASIDTLRWTHEVNAAGGGNNELQYYTARPENSHVADGMLHIVARRESFTGPEGTRQYTSARLNTRLKGDWTHGRFEARVRLPEGRGVWPALWMLPTASHYGEWAASGEIDIIELRGQRPATVHGTLHYGASWPGNVHVGDSLSLPDRHRFSESFHVFTLIWEPDAFHWYVDGRHYQTQTSWWTEGHPFPAPFDRDFHLILNVAVGGEWPGSPDETTGLPQEMVVDYVRVYRR